LRLGTPSITSRGFGVEETKRVASLIMRAINHRGESNFERSLCEEVLELTGSFPVPGLDI